MVYILCESFTGVSYLVKLSTDLSSIVESLSFPSVSLKSIYYDQSLGIISAGRSTNRLALYHQIDPLELKLIDLQTSSYPALAITTISTISVQGSRVLGCLISDPEGSSSTITHNIGYLYFDTDNNFL